MHLRANSQYFSLASTAHLVYYQIIEAKKLCLAPGKSFISKLKWRFSYATTILYTSTNSIPYSMAYNFCDSCDSIAVFFAVQAQKISDMPDLQPPLVHDRILSSRIVLITYHKTL